MYFQTAGLKDFTKVYQVTDSSRIMKKKKIQINKFLQRNSVTKPAARFSASQVSASPWHLQGELGCKQLNSLLLLQKVLK